MIQVVIIAPALSARAGLRAILSAGGDFEVTAEAASPEDLAAFDATADIFLIQPSPSENLQIPDTALAGETLPAVLVLTDTPTSAGSLPNTDLRAWGVLPTNCSQEELITALYALEMGLTIGDPAMLNEILSAPSSNNSHHSGRIELTGRELEVLDLLAEGYANKQISADLGISEHTVKFHVSSIYTKLNVSNRAEAVRIGIQMGLIAI